MTTRLIRWFVGKYGVNMAEAANPDIASYTQLQRVLHARAEGRRAAARRRRLRLPGGWRDQPVRPIEDDQIFQAKGHTFSTDRAGRRRRTSWRRSSTHGSFANLYLSPKDYHRIHMPCDGRLTRMIYVPGDAVFGEPDHGARRARPVRAQRARGVRVRVGAAGRS